MADDERREAAPAGQEAGGGEARQPLVDALLAAAHDPLLILDGRGELLAANQAALAALPQGSGSSFPELLGAEAREALNAALSGSSASFIAPAGEGHLLWRLDPIASAAGGSERVVASGVDPASIIKERRDLFHRVLDALPIGVNIFNPALMRSFYMNDAFVSIHGWPQEIVRDGRALHEHTFPDLEVRKRVIEQIEHDVASRNPDRMRWRLDIVTQSGERRHIHAINTPLPELGLQVGTVQDITEPWRARLELERSERRFRIIAEQTGQVVYDCDLETGQVHWAGAIERVTGYSAAELSLIDRKAWEELIHLEDRDLFARSHTELTPESGVCEVEYRLQRKDGSYVWVEDSAVIVSGGAGADRLLGRMKDISERIQAEEERERLSALLQQAQRMESIGRLAGGIAHDFNNLLTGILGNVTLAQLDPSGKKTPERLSQIEQAAESAASLTRQLLAFSRSQVIEPRVLDLGEVLQRFERLLVRTLGEDIELRVAANARGRARVDLVQLEQIVLNLAVNARDAMPEGGSLLLETADVMLDEAYCQRHAQAVAGPYVMLAVSDSGAGLTDEARLHLFEPFFTTKPRGMGTGLGLSTVYGAVKQNGGLIDVYSEAGHGTTFKIYFPRAEGEAESLPSPASRSAQGLPGGDEAILLVEDDPGVRRFAEELLAQLGYRVLSTGSGSETLELLQTSADLSIQLLLSDVVLPDLSGRDLAETVQARYGVPRVLFTSGYTEDVVIRHGVLNRGIAFLPKPYTPERLARKVREVLDAPARAVARSARG